MEGSHTARSTPKQNGQLTFYLIINNIVLDIFRNDPWHFVLKLLLIYIYIFFVFSFCQMLLFLLWSSHSAHFSSLKKMRRCCSDGGSTQYFSSVWYKVNVPTCIIDLDLKMGLESLKGFSANSAHCTMHIYVFLREFYMLRLCSFHKHKKRYGTCKQIFFIPCCM